jgi:uncharacterized membrane protein YqgA involved in biofilm formation
MLFKRGIPERVNTAIIKAEGIAILIIGLNGVLTAMLSIGAGGKLQADGAILLLISLAVGCVAGELIRIEDRLNGFAGRIERKLKADNFSKGFVTATLVYVIGAMGIVGAINDGLTGDSTVLFTKSLLDGITSIILASTFGVGVMFSAAPVFIYQGVIAMLARFIAPYVTDEPIRLLSMVGYSLVMAIGFNFLADTKVRIANLLPALAVPIIYYIFLTNI